MRVLGVDVSHWEGWIDWELAAPTLGFAYYKATDGVDYVDNQFLNNKAGCDKMGLAHAGYHYFQPAINPVDQARHFIRTLGGGYKRYIGDFEKAGCNATNMKAFLDECANLTGVRPAIYTSPGFWDSIYPRPTWEHEYDLLVAHYTAARNPTLPIGWSSWRIWQFSDYFFHPGNNEIADGNWYNGTMDECRNWFGNYHPITIPSAERTQMRVIVDKLMIRTGPSTSYPTTGYLTKGAVIEVYDAGGYSSWIKHAKGWSAYSTSGNKYLEAI